MIDTYSFGSIIINGKNFSKDLILAWPALSFWWRGTSHEVAVKDIESIMTLKPKLIIFGTGDTGLMKVLPEVEKFLADNGVQFKVLPTSEAAVEYNRHSGETGLVGAFHLTC